MSLTWTSTSTTTFDDGLAVHVFEQVVNFHHDLQCRYPSLTSKTIRSGNPTEHIRILALDHSYLWQPSPNHIATVILHTSCRHAAPPTHLSPRSNGPPLLSFLHNSLSPWPLSGPLTARAAFFYSLPPALSTPVLLHSSSSVSCSRSRPVRLAPRLSFPGPSFPSFPAHTVIPSSSSTCSTHPVQRKESGCLLCERALFD